MKMKNEQQLWQTTVREVYIEPYVPPPIIHSIRIIDEYIYKSIDVPEATITIVTTVFMAYIVVRIMVWLSSTMTTATNKRALKDINDESSLYGTFEQQPQYDATVLLTGPRSSGKTRIFFQLTHPEMSHSYVPTVTSLKTNIAYATTVIPPLLSTTVSTAAANVTLQQQQQQQQQQTATISENQPTQEPIVIRYIDYPGFASIYDTQYIDLINNNNNNNNNSTTTTNATRTKAKNNNHLSSLLPPPPPPRIVLVVDATQPVTAAAEILFQLFHILYDTHCQKKNSSTSKQSSLLQQRPSIFVACHKKDSSKAKNEKRIKIQIRTELERLIYSAQMTAPTITTPSSDNNRTSTATNANGGWWCCPPRTTSTTTGTTNSSNSSNISAFTTIAVDLDELAFVQMYFYATSSCERGGGNELLEFCTTGSVTTTTTTSIQ